MTRPSLTVLPPPVRNMLGVEWSGARVQWLQGRMDVTTEAGDRANCVEREREGDKETAWRKPAHDREREIERAREREREKEKEIERVKNIETKREGQGDREEATEGKSETERKKDRERERVRTWQKQRDEQRKAGKDVGREVQKGKRKRGKTEIDRREMGEKAT